MSSCSKKHLLIGFGLLLLLLLVVGIGVGVYMIGAEEACEQDQAHGEKVMSDVLKKITADQNSRMIDTRISQDALHVLERLTCTEPVDTWSWRSMAPNFTLPGFAGEECCGIPHPAELPDASWIETVAKRLLDVRCHAPTDISDIDKQLCGYVLGAVRKPDTDRWDTDAEFVRSFTQGVNPLMLRSVRDLGEIRVQLREKLGHTLGDLLQDKKLFVADYSALAKIPLVEGRVFYAPQVLLVKNSGGADLDFLAIHLYHPEAPESQNNQVVTPNTPRWRKIFAWMHVALADAQIHEFPHHLRDHLVMEAVSIARHNHLGDSHIIGRLLKPHMTMTIFMNFAARHSLIKPKDSLTQQQFSVGRYGALKLISDEMLNKYFWQNMTFPRMMEEKGFPENQTDGLQQYHYRDDGFKLWNALHNYVDKVVNGSYPSEQEVEKDEKLTEFFASLADPKRGNIPGFPRTPGDRAELTETLTSMIFTASVQHQAVNAPQFTYTFQPHRPLTLTRWMPNEDEEIPNKAWITDATAETFKENAQGIYQLANILSTPMQGQCNLLALDTFKDEVDIPFLKQAHDQLHSELDTLHNHINSTRVGPDAYNFLDPANVPCSIDI